jgi:hypothetical protein
MLLKLFIRLITPTRVFRNYIREAVEITNLNIIPILTVNIIFALIIVGTYSGLMFLVFKFFYERNAQNVALGFSGLPIVAYLLCGIIRFYFSLVRKAKINMSLLLVDYRKYFHILLLLIIYYTIYVLYVKIAADFADFDGRVVRIRIILGLFTFLWLLVRLIFSPLFVVDKGYTARKAMKASFLLTSGKTMKTFSLVFFSTLLFLSGFFLGIGFLYTFSLIMIGFVLSFDINLKNRFSRRRKLINEAAVETKRQLEDTGFFKSVKEEIPENE